MVFLTSVAAVDVNVTKRLKSMWRESAHGAVWRSPSVPERDALRRAMRQIIAGADQCSQPTLDAARAELAIAGFQLDEFSSAGTRYLVVREAPSAGRGGGMYAIRCGPASAWVLEAPHSFFDSRTGLITRELFRESQARAAFWNTVHRYKATPGEEKEDEIHPADVAHEPGNFFQAATVGAVVADPKLAFIQIHGFGKSKEIPFAGVLSSGRKGLEANKLKAALKPLGAFAVYGADTKEFGATTNAQGRMLNRIDPGRFLHVELSPDTRAKLSKDAKARALFLKALSGPWW